MLEWVRITPEGQDIEAKTEIGTYTISYDSPLAGGAANLWMAGADVDTFEVYPRRVDALNAAEADYFRRRMS